MPPSPALAFKAYEIEELVDVYFYRRLGYLVACAARVVRISPNAVSILAAVIGGLGGLLVAWPSLAWTGIALLVLHGVIDSADGQLARMTGQTSELGRVLDGIAGYVTHIAIYVAIIIAVHRATGRWDVLAVALLSGVFTAIQAQLYDYHRTAYAAVVVQGRVPTELAGISPAGPLGPLVGWYGATQRALLGLHARVETVLAARAVDGRVPDDDRQAYRAFFYRPVCGWNLLGDNVRRYAIAVCVLFGRPEWFMPFTLGPMNVALAALWFYQQSADRRFLGAFDRASGHTPAG